MFLSQLLCVTDSFPTCSDYLLLSLLRAVVAILDSFHFPGQTIGKEVEIVREACRITTKVR